MIALRQRWAMALVALAALAVGCSKPPQVNRGSRHLVKTLRTAVSAKNSQWLEENAKLVENQRAAQQLNDEEYGALRAIVDQGRAGEWKAAQAAVVALESAQTPTADDLERLKSRERN